MEKGSLRQDNLLSSAFWKNIPGDRKEFPIWVERVVARGVPTSVFLLAPFGVWILKLALFGFVLHD
ncbi:MAG: hypothetical protein ISS70_03320 [Phycisphaerae bacterium]|nr:hypothetical protein [Phycisphaerae bacterium]